MAEKYYPLGDEIGSIELIDHMGNDLSVVNAARVSFDNESKSFEGKDKKLIHYLLKHKHYSPIRGVVFTFRVKCPLFLARQWWKHVIASSYSDSQQQWNEVSFRYVTIDEPEFYFPTEFRAQSKDNKQGSESGDIPQKNARYLYERQCLASSRAYADLIELGICREQARAVLVPAVYTSFIWTVSLQALLNFISLRKGDGAQSEIQKYASAIEDIISTYVPVTMEAWNEYENL